MKGPVLILLGWSLAALAVGSLAAQRADKSTERGTTMIARGTFEVQMTPRPQDDPAGGPFERLFGAKQFHGDLEGTSKGHMLATRSSIEGSGAYVALELVTGKLNGKQGSFVLQHNGTMRKGAYEMRISVTPDSGTEELAGISGTMTILIENGKHSFVFEYTLP